MSSYSLEEVKSRRQQREFLDMVKYIYVDSPFWIRPLDNDIDVIFDPQKNNKFDGGDAMRWLVRSPEGKVVGRIAAFYNQEQASIERQPTGGCGFFECVDNQEVANMLFDSAREWLVERGMEAMDGPINFGSRDMWWGVLVEGFDIEPLYANPYNPPYYQKLFEEYGFKLYFNQYTYFRSMDTTLPDNVVALIERLKQKEGYTFEHIRKEDLDTLPEDFRKVYNNGWAKLEGVNPMTKEEVNKLFKTLKPIMDERLIYLARHNGEAIGFFVMFPDLNRLIKPFNGKLGFIQKLKLLWGLKRHNSDRIFAMTFGVDPAYHRRGVESGMINAFAEEVNKGKLKYKSLELAWIGDFNPLMMRVATRIVEAKPIKRHITYRYLFDRTLEFHRCPIINYRNNS